METVYNKCWVKGSASWICEVHLLEWITCYIVHNLKCGLWVSRITFFPPFLVLTSFPLLDLLRYVMDITEQNPSISSEVFPNFFFLSAYILESFVMSKFIVSCSFKFLLRCFTNSVICEIFWFLILHFFYGPKDCIP